MMATSLEVMQYLRPDGGWVLVGDDFEGITFYEAEPFTKAEFEAAFPNCDLFLAEKEAEKQAQKTSLYERLGLTAEEAALLLGAK